MWDGDHLLDVVDDAPILVLSPPCGMVTILQTVFNCKLFSSSEPTVWDGDYIHSKVFLFKTSKVLSPPCGMVTKTPPPRSDIPILFQAHRVGWRLSNLNIKGPVVEGSKPTVWDGDFTTSLKVFSLNSSF